MTAKQIYLSIINEFNLLQNDDQLTISTVSSESPLSTDPKNDEYCSSVKVKHRGFLTACQS